MSIDAPILTKLITDKDSRSAQSFSSALARLNSGLTDKKIWNVEINDAKFTLSNGVNIALDAVFHRYLGGRGRSNYEEWTNDLSMFCSFNQAAGRIKRLVKKAPKTEIVAEFIAAYQEVDAIWKAICELKPYTVKGRRPNENKTEAQIAEELFNTGICAICGNRQKLSENRMVHHGYQMSEYNHAGYRVGKCFGTRYLCYELSCEANIAFAPILKAHLKDYRSALKVLKSGTVETLIVQRHKYEGGRQVPYNVVLTKGTDEFDRELENRIDSVKANIRFTLSDIESNDSKTLGWTLQPLKYGGKS
jgi:hypothetical protein